MKKAVILFALALAPSAITAMELSPRENRKALNRKKHENREKKHKKLAQKHRGGYQPLPGEQPGTKRLPADKKEKKKS